MVKIKCVKLECEVCNKIGLAQIFLNKDGRVRYCRVRHYKGLNEFKKPQFEYHKIEDLEILKTSLKNQTLQFPISRNGHLGQSQKANDVALKLKDSNLNFKMEADFLR